MTCLYSVNTLSFCLFIIFLILCWLDLISKCCRIKLVLVEWHCPMMDDDYPKGIHHHCVWVYIRCLSMLHSCIIGK